MRPTALLLVLLALHALQADVTLSNPLRLFGGVQVRGLTKITLDTATDLISPLLDIRGPLVVDAKIIIVLPISDIASFIPLLEFDNLELRKATDDEWLSLHLLLPRCGSLKSIAIRTNETHAWAELKGVSCAAAETAKEMAIFIGLGAGCAALLIVVLALRVSQWTYVIYDTSEKMRRGYEKVREYFPLPQGPAPMTEEFMRDVVREEHEDGLE